MIDLFPDVVQLVPQVVGLAVGQDEQQLIAAEPNQNVGLPDAAPHDCYHRFQRKVAGMVAVSIVVNFEVVNVDEGDAGRAGHGADNILVIAAVEHVGQSVVVELGVVARDAADEFFLVFGVDGGVAGHLLDQLEDVRLPVDLVILRDDLDEIGTKELELAAVLFGAQSLFRGAVAAQTVLVPAGVAQMLAVRIGAQALGHFVQHRAIQQPHVRIEWTQILNQILYLVHGTLHRFDLFKAKLPNLSSYYT